jgi:hypothetical protein
MKRFPTLMIVFALPIVLGSLLYGQESPNASPQFKDSIVNFENAKNVEDDFEKSDTNKVNHYIQLGVYGPYSYFSLNYCNEVNLGRNLSLTNRIGFSRHNTYIKLLGSGNPSENKKLTYFVLNPSLIFTKWRFVQPKIIIQGDIIKFDRLPSTPDYFRSSTWVSFDFGVGTRLINRKINLELCIIYSKVKDVGATNSRKFLSFVRPQFLISYKI